MVPIHKSSKEEQPFWFPHHCYPKVQTSYLQKALQAPQCARLQRLPQPHPPLQPLLWSEPGQPAKGWWGKGFCNICWCKGQIFVSTHLCSIIWQLKKWTSLTCEMGSNDCILSSWAAEGASTISGGGFECLATSWAPTCWNVWSMKYVNIMLFAITCPNLLA